MFKRINAHGHLLPYPEQIPAFMKEKGIFWIDEDRKAMHQGEWTRPVTDPSFFLEEKLEWMDKNRIDHEVILNLSQLYCSGYPKDLAKEVCRFQNDFNAGIQKDHPERFTGGFVVMVAYLDNALEELRRCVEELDMRLLCLPSHFVDEEGQWKSIADESLFPVFELANHYGLAVEIHPYDGPRIINLENRYWRFHLVWMCAQTADSYHFYTLLGFPDRFPEIRTCFAHGNQFGQMNIGRREQGFKGRPDLFEGTESPQKYVGHPNIYFDTLVHDLLSLEMLIRRQGLSQVLAGMDDPYPLGEMESVPGSYPGLVIDEARESGLIDEKGYEDIWYHNVLRWLGKKGI
jgi:aminocarboxymuconate-semialdehyde decarboxylase